VTSFAPECGSSRRNLNTGMLYSRLPSDAETAAVSRPRDAASWWVGQLFVPVRHELWPGRRWDPRRVLGQLPYGTCGPGARLIQCGVTLGRSKHRRAPRRSMLRRAVSLPTLSWPTRFDSLFWWASYDPEAGSAIVPRRIDPKDNDPARAFGKSAIRDDPGDLSSHKNRQPGEREGFVPAVASSV